jgi:hypothetical protein
VDGRAFDGQPSPEFLLPAASDPRDAQREEGERLLQAAVVSIAQEVRQALERLHPQE